MTQSSLTRLAGRNPSLYATLRRVGYALLGFYGATVARAFSTMMWPVYRRTHHIRRRTDATGLLADRTLVEFKKVDVGYGYTADDAAVVFSASRKR
jgi:hypothetical protein